MKEKERRRAHQLTPVFPPKIIPFPVQDHKSPNPSAGEGIRFSRGKVFVSPSGRQVGTSEARSSLTVGMIHVWGLSICLKKGVSIPICWSVFLRCSDDVMVPLGTAYQAVESWKQVKDGSDACRDGSTQVGNVIAGKLVGTHVAVADLLRLTDHDACSSREENDPKQQIMHYICEEPAAPQPWHQRPEAQ